MNLPARMLAAETVKLRRSWALLVALLAPLTQTLFLFIVLWFSEDRVRQIGTGFQAWYQVNHGAWNLFFLPITVALVSALSWGQESEAAAWKHLLSQPVPRYSHLLTKLISIFSLVLIAQLLLAAMLVVGGVALRGYAPQLAMGEFEPIRLLRFSLLSLLGSLPLVAVHVWIGVYSQRITAALLLALGGTWIAAYLEINSSSLYLWPWGVASRVPTLAHAWKGMPWGMLLALPVSVLLAVVAAWDFSRRRQLGH